MNNRLHVRSGRANEPWVPRDRTADRLILSVWLATAVLLILPLLLRSYLLLTTPAARVRELIDYIFDDGYYYLTIGANLADFGRSTFDGQTATNGYQPLWLLALAVLAKVIGSEPIRLFKAACLAIYAIACASPFIAAFWLKDQLRHRALYIAAGLAVVIA